MIIEVRLPEEDQVLEEGTLVGWKIKEGSPVQKGDVLAEIETPKAIVELEAPASGVISRLLVQEGDVFSLKGALAIIEQGTVDEACLAVPAEKESGGGSEPDAPSQVGADHARVLATPAARRLARDRGVDLGRVSGSGPGGRVQEGDVLAFVEAGDGAEPQPGGQAAGDRSAPLSPLRRAIAKKLTLSKQTIPHFYLTVEVDAQPLWEAHLQRKGVGEVSLNDFIVEATAAALKEFPEVNSRLAGDHQVFRSEVNIGIAVHVPEGLRIPVIRGADRLSLAEISRLTAELVRKAREGRVEGAGAGTFTITNLGMFDVAEFAAVINPPEVAILAVGRVRETPVVRDGAVVAGRTLRLTLSGDHRAFDGVTGARFLGRIKARLEALS